MVYSIQNYVQKIGGWNPPKIGKYKHVADARAEAIKKSKEWADTDSHGASVIILKDGAQIGYVDAYGPNHFKNGALKGKYPMRAITGVAVFHTWTKSNTGYIIDKKGNILCEW